ncbi:uncharacterized protein LOC132378375 isoform X2 [Hypanus sabinus]|uniref:uncharacterized protein LOC132378375 isoform X2 n=1 Tax=Hypanus sabinus TaxID=79690 RepID=UPI0028C3CF41|nr:uncharacterized protein LOC132378375 isoform X2 [Hypanus sabinus]
MERGSEKEREIRPPVTLIIEAFVGDLPKAIEENIRCKSLEATQWMSNNTHEMLVEHSRPGSIYREKRCRRFRLRPFIRTVDIRSPHCVCSAREHQMRHVTLWEELFFALEDGYSPRSMDLNNSLVHSSVPATTSCLTSLFNAILYNGEIKHRFDNYFLKYLCPCCRNNVKILIVGCFSSPFHSQSDPFGCCCCALQGSPIQAQLSSRFFEPVYGSIC